MKLEIFGNIYEIEYTFEAAHYKNCVQKAWDYFSGASMMKDASINDVFSGDANKIMTLNSIMGAMCSVPDMVITFLYAGLLEHHGDDVRSERDARALYKQFAKEHPDDDRAMEFGMLEAIRKQMEDDGFFKRIGLQDLMDSMKQETQEVPEDMPETSQK